MTAELVRIEQWIEEELLYSVMARTQMEVATVDPRALLECVAGSRNVIPSADLPCHLIEIHRRFGIAAGFESVEAMMYRATLFPYFMFFMQPERRATTLQRSRNGSGAGLKTQIGIVANGFGASTRLRYCRECARSCLDQFGDAPWLRVHQLPGVLVCPLHGEVLVGLAPQSDFSHRHRFVLPDLRARPPVMSSGDKHDLRRLAKLSEAVLLAASCGTTMPAYATAYRTALRCRGLLRGTSQIDWTRLREALLDGVAGSRAFPFKERVALHSTEIPYWIRAATGGRASQLHPLCHIVMIDGLFGSFDRFLEAANAPGDSEQERCESPRTEALVADLSDAASVLRNDGLSCRQAASQLGVSVATVVKRRRQLGVQIAERRKILSGDLMSRLLVDLAKGLPMAEIASAHRVSVASLYRVLSTDVNARKARVLARTLAVCEAHRLAWTTAVASAEDSKVADIRGRVGASYAWLRRHDTAWLDEHLPARYRGQRRPRVDWAARDIELAERVPAAATAIRRRSKLVRVTTNEIVRHLSCTAIWRRHQKRLPAFRGALEAHAETLHEYRQRCTTWQEDGSARERI